MCAIELVGDRDTKEPLGADIAERGRAPIPRAWCARAHGRYVRQRRFRLLPPITIDDALLADGLDVLDAAIGAGHA